MDTEKTVASASRSLTDCERKHSIIEKEALACVWSAECWRTYPWGRHLTLRTDHSPLTALLYTKGFGRAGMRISRWSARLICFNYTVTLRQAKVKRYVDERRGARFLKFQCGSYVRIRKPGIIKKGHSMFTQPLRVVAQTGTATYELSKGKVWNAVHLSPASFPSPEVHTTSNSVQPEDVYKPPETPPPARPSPRPQRSRRQIQPRAWLGDFAT